MIDDGHPEWQCLEVLEGKHNIAILLYLLERGCCTKTEIYSTVSRGSGMIQRLDAFRRAGLIEVDDANRSHLVRLTESGIRVAIALKGVMEMLPDYYR